MSLSRYRRLTATAGAASLVLALLAVTPVAARPPGWQFIDAFTGVAATTPCPLTGCKAITSSPTTVGPNQLAAYHVTIKNNGSSNISALYLSTDIPASNPAGNPVAWVNNTGENNSSCRHDPSLPLYCSFPALNSGASFTIEVVFRAPASSLSFHFRADGNGNTPTDGGTSHGDSLLGATGFDVNASANFAGGFQLDGGDVQNNQSVGRNNIQGSSVHQDGTLLPVTIQDNLTYTGAGGTGTDPCGSLSCIGDWTRVQVGAGSEGPIEVKLLIYGKTIKGNPSLTTGFGLVHDGNLITESCATEGSVKLVGATGDECLDVTTVGSNYLIDAWLKHNGTGRGVLLG